jgi:hypothetical protein
MTKQYGNLVGRLCLYSTLVIAMIYAGTFLGTPRGAEAIACCMYGVDCTASQKMPDPVCCLPSGGQAQCSELFPNYCKNTSCY